MQIELHKAIKRAKPNTGIGNLNKEKESKKKNKQRNKFISVYQIKFNKLEENGKLFKD